MVASRHSLSVTFCALLFASAFLHGQDQTGTLSGRIVDSQGTALPQVQLTVRNLDTGQTRQTTSTEAGTYLVGLAPGEYELIVVAPGWKRLTFPRVQVRAQDRPRLDVTLERGEGEATPSAAPQLESQPTGIRSTIGRTWLEALPLLNRNFVPLIALTPGVSSDLADEVGFRDDGTPRVSIAGGRRSSVAWLLDGVSLIDRLNNATLIANPALESIQEIDIATNNYRASWPSSGDGVVQVITRTGGSTVSGSAYEFARTDQLNSRNFFARTDTLPATTEPPRLRYHNFGYSVGGTIPPKRNSVRFFFSEEWRHGSGERRIVSGWF